MEVRTDDRIPVALDGRVQFIGGEAPVHVVDISPGGCRMVTESDRLRKGMILVVSLMPGFDVRGRILWRRESQVGMLFNAPVEKELLSQLLAGELKTDHSLLKPNSGRPVFPV